MFKWKIARKMLKSVKQICNENVFYKIVKNIVIIPLSK